MTESEKILYEKIQAAETLRKDLSNDENHAKGIKLMAKIMSGYFYNEGDIKGYKVIVNGFIIESWYDSISHSWITQTKDIKTNYQIESADVNHAKDSASVAFCWRVIAAYNGEYDKLLQ